MSRLDAVIAIGVGLALASGPVDELRVLGVLVALAAVTAVAARHDREAPRVDHVGSDQPAPAPARRSGDLVGAGHGDTGGRA